MKISKCGLAALLSLFVAVASSSAQESGTKQSAVQDDSAETSSTASSLTQPDDVAQPAACGQYRCVFTGELTSLRACVANCPDICVVDCS